MTSPADSDTSDQVAEAEVVVVERVDQAAHGFDTAAHIGAIGVKLTRRIIAVGQRCVHRVGSAFAAASARKTPDLNTGSRNAKASPMRTRPSSHSTRTVGVFARHAIRTELLAHGQVLLDPGIVAHLAMEDLGQVAACPCTGSPSRPRCPRSRRRRPAGCTRTSPSPERRRRWWRLRPPRHRASLPCSKSRRRSC